MTRHKPSLAGLALTFGLLFGVIAPISVAQAAQSSDWTQATRTLVLARAEQALGNYFFANRVALLRGAIEAHRSELLRIDSEKAFTNALTSILQQAGQDKHIIVWFSEAPDENQSRKPTPAELASQQHFFQYVAYGYNASARLPGNIGYIALGGFADMPAAKGTIDAAMELVSQTSSLIVDLRGNGGGDSDTVDYLLAYFFAKPTRSNGSSTTSSGQRCRRP